MEDKKLNVNGPIFVLAPMANITTYPFASQTVKFGADLVWTPMVHTDTIINNWDEARKILDFKEIKNYIVQIVGSNEENFAEAIRVVTKELHPVGIDLNFSCPDKNIVKSGCGGALMKDLIKIISIVKAAQNASSLPLSIKLRSGWDSDEGIYKLLGLITAEDIKLNFITIHPRTVKQGFKGDADWAIVRNIATQYSQFRIIGSGDIATWEDALTAYSESKCYGIMIGRGALGKPWIFKEIKEKRDYSPDLTEIKALVLELAQKSHQIWGYKGITEAKKHFSWYFKGFPGASSYRSKLMLSSTLADVKRVLK